MRGEGREDNIWADDVHSNKPHQQYSDFLKSTMYRNSRLLVTCSDCHDMHGGAYNRFLICDPGDSASALCQRCHAVNLLTHMETKLNSRMKGEQTRCIDCHMPTTANTGGVAGEYGRMIRTPPYTSVLEEENNAYWQGALRSHVFDDSQGNTVVRRVERERIFETVIAVGVPTTIPRVGFTFEVSVKPWVKGNSPELETELNLHWLRSEDTNGWVESHFDIIDKYSPGGRPHNTDIYTHKLNFELDTAVPFLK